MSEKMQAVVFHAPGDVRVEQVPTAECGKAEMLVQVDACAVCGSDLKSSKVGNPRIKPPLTMGHEFTGIIRRIGPAAKSAGLSVGGRVVMATTISCGQCEYCRRGWPNVCANLAPMGFSYPGGMAEFVVIPERALVNGHVVGVPPHLPAEHAALAEPVSCAVNCAENCGLREGDTVVVLGAGPMGLINACVARAMGAAQIILSEVSPRRLAMAEGFGCDILVNPDSQDLAAIVKDATGGIGADVAIVAAPAAAPQEQAVHLIRKRGSVCLFASLPAGKHILQMDSRAIHYNELRVIGTSDSTPAHVATAVALLASGRIPADKIATHILPLSEIHQAFELMERGEALRVVLKPTP